MASEIVFRNVTWSPRLAAKIKNACGWGWTFINAELVNGISQAWDIDGIGVMITRLENHESGPVLVVVAAQGKNALPVLKKLPDIAKANGALPGSEGIRIHSQRPGMWKYLKRLGNYRRELSLGETVFYGRV